MFRGKLAGQLLTSDEGFRIFVLVAHCRSHFRVMADQFRSRGGTVNKLEGIVESFARFGFRSRRDVASKVVSIFNVTGHLR